MGAWLVEYWEEDTGIPAMSTTMTVVVSAEGFDEAVAAVKAHVPTDKECRVDGIMSCKRVAEDVIDCDGVAVKCTKVGPANG